MKPSLILLNSPPLSFGESLAKNLTLLVCASHKDLHKPFYLCFLCLCGTFFRRKLITVNPFAKRVQDSQKHSPTFLKESRQRTLALLVCASYISLCRPFYLCPPSLSLRERWHCEAMTERDNAQPYTFSGGRRCRGSVHTISNIILCCRDG